MTVKPKNPLSSDALLSVVIAVAGVGAFVFDPWEAKVASVTFALGLIVYAGRRHDSHALVRYPVAIAAIFAFSFAPWGSVWVDFHKENPGLSWPEFITWNGFHWALAILASIVLLWRWRPVWLLRQGIAFQWRRAVESEVWTDRAKALKIIENSKWGVSRKPGGGFFGSMEFMMKPSLFSQYTRFCQMTLDSFADANKSYVREQGETMEYREDKLWEWLRQAYDDDVRKQFGNIPYKAV